MFRIEVRQPDGSWITYQNPTHKKVLTRFKTIEDAVYIAGYKAIKEGKKRVAKDDT